MAKNDFVMQYNNNIFWDQYCNNTSQYYNFYYVFDQMNTDLVRIRYLKKKKKLKHFTYQKLLNGSVMFTTIIFT